MTGQALDMMDRQLQLMARLIDDLLDLSRIRGGKIVLHKVPLDLAAVVQQAVETSRPVMAQGGHDFRLILPGQPLRVEADLTRLAQAFANLLNNAAKYTPAGGRIALSVERREGEASIRVCDNGIGIPAVMLGRVFDLFTQVDRSLEKSRGGLGIGLALVKRLVELHGGSVEAHSEGIGRGSEFVVRLPLLTQPDAPASRPAGVDLNPPAEARCRVLVVDDNADAAGSLSMLLETLGHEVCTAADGMEAVDAAAAFRPQLILMDIGMPRMNGYEACASIRTQAWGRTVTIAAVTGWGQDHDRQRSREAGFDHHFVKPLDPAQLDRLLQDLPSRRTEQG
jgi:CheY-like chemotaxis protein